MHSIYAQITDRCNMRCPHCCFRCTSKGSDMTLTTFKAVLSIASHGDSIITIGGGEPTLHKQCLDFTWLAVRATLEVTEEVGMAAVGFVTNGSVKKAALEVAHMAKMGLVSARLSYDSFHDVSMVDPVVLRAFKSSRVDNGFGSMRKDERDLREINEWTYFVTPHGRALDNGIANHPFHKKGSCCCDGLFVSPNGDIWQCGCRKHKLGHVSNLNDFYRAYTEALNDDGELYCSEKETGNE